MYCAGFLFEVIPSLVNFWGMLVLNELLSRRLESGHADQANPEVDSGNLCICGKDKGGTMVGCDNANCHVQWFHLQCLGTKEDPARKFGFANSVRKK